MEIMLQIRVNIVLDIDLISIYLIDLNIFFNTSCHLFCNCERFCKPLFWGVRYTLSVTYLICFNIYSGPCDELATCPGSTLPSP